MHHPKFLTRLVSAMSLGLVWTSIYGWLNKYGSNTPRAIVWDSPIERWPWMYMPELAVPYLVLGLLLPFIPLFFPLSRVPFMRAMLGLTSTGVMCLVTYGVFPVRMIRPTYDTGRTGEAVMRWITSLDGPANCLPSSHAAFAMCAAVLVSHHYRHVILLRWGIWITTGIIVISTFAVGQHYLIDAAVGVLVGYTGACVGIQLVSSPESSHVAL